MFPDAATEDSSVNCVISLTVPSTEYKTGGPDDSTLFYAYYLFNNAFRYFKMAYASALAWILFLVILALTLLQLKLAPRWVHYEAN